MEYIQKLREVIRRLHDVEAKYVDRVLVRETFQDKTVWEGIVEVFELKNHPKAPRVYAWAHDTDNPKQPRRPCDGLAYCACHFGCGSGTSRNRSGV